MKMSAVELPEFAIDLKSVEKDIKRLLKVVKPQWSEEKLTIKKITGGYSCLTSCVFLEEKPDDAIVVRVRLPKAECLQVWIDPKFELKVIKVLSKLGLFPTVHASFQNGLCYQFIPGEPVVSLSKGMTNPDVNPSLIKAMVEKLAEIHSVKLENEDYSTSDLFSKIEDILEKGYPENSDVIGKAQLKNEFTELLSYSKEFKFNIVLCHGDSHAGNVVWNKAEDKVYFVDWEMSHVGYQAYDLAYFLQMLFFFDDILQIPRLLSTEEVQIDESKVAILKQYFDKWSSLNSRDANEGAFKEFRRQVAFFELIWCLTFVIVFTALTTAADADGQSVSEYPVDPKMMIGCAYQHYCRIKEKKLQEIKNCV